MFKDRVKYSKLLGVLFCMVSLLLCLTGCSSKDKGSGSGKPEIASALELLSSVWTTYADEEKFPAAGGDMSEEHMSMDGPGIYDLQDAEAIDSVFGVPKDTVEWADDAASLMHMMNANTFTCGAFHIKDSNKCSAFADNIKANLKDRQWMCGFPDKLVVMGVGDYIVSIFGKNEQVDTFKDKLLQVYPSATIMCEEPLL